MFCTSYALPAIGNDPCPKTLFHSEIVGHPEQELNVSLKQEVIRQEIFDTLRKYQADESIKFGDRVVFIDFPVDTGNSLLLRA